MFDRQIMHGNVKMCMAITVQKQMHSPFVRIVRRVLFNFAYNGSYTHEIVTVENVGIVHYLEIFAGRRHFCRQSTRLSSSF
jgi:hypothetical protein